MPTSSKTPRQSKSQNHLVSIGEMLDELIISTLIEIGHYMAIHELTDHSGMLRICCHINFSSLFALLAYEVFSLL